MTAEPALLQGFTREFLQYLFSYDPETGLVRRRVRRRSQPAGKVVGTVDGKGYLHVNLEGKFIRLHRLIWFIETGVVPAKGLDHRNNIRTDNRWLNLRETTQSGNSGNTGLSRHNTSGYKGVYWYRKGRLWAVQIKIHGKQTYLGRYHDIRAAALVYNHAALAHFGDFAQINDVTGYGLVGVAHHNLDLFL